jgi:hypothetical protein
MRKILYIAWLLLTLTLILFLEAQSKTLWQLIRDCRERSINFDSGRLPDSTLKRFYNIEQENIARQHDAIERCTTYVLTTDLYVYPYPGNCYNVIAIHINKDPSPAPGMDATPYSLTEVPFHEFGKVPAFETGRPRQFCQFADSIFFDRFSATGNDTLRVCYSIHATEMTDSASTMSLPTKYESLLIDQVAIRAYHRLEMIPPPMDTTKNEQ